MFQQSAQSSHISTPLPRASRVFAEKHLSDIQRRSGESYATHGIEVATTLRELNSDSELLSAAILHDILVHPQGLFLLEQSPLSIKSRDLVQRMYDLRRLHIDENTEDLDTVIDAFADDPQLLQLRMAHRLTDVRHLERFDAKLGWSVAHESLHMYTAIAGRLGMYAWRYEMEDRCFQIVNPEVAQSLEQSFHSMRSIDHTCLEQTKKFLMGELQKRGMQCSIDYRIKGMYSTYRKMILKNRTFEELTDRIALRIVVDTIENCYFALGIVHGSMNPIPGKLKDYIGAPKENGYQSIHTVVYPLPGITEQPIEIQIRTHEMDQACEFGAIAHGHYKNYVYALNKKPARVNLFRNLQNLRAESRTPEQFEDALRQYFREDHIAIFDEDNNLHHFRKPLTALDAALHIYDKRCKALKKIRINGRVQSLDTPLQDGDTLGVHFSRMNQYHDGWKDMCIHPVHQTMIEEWLSK